MAKVNGIMAFKSHPNAPSFVKASIVISPSELMKFVDENQELLTNHDKYGSQLKLQLKEDREGKYYLDVDTYKKA